MLDTMGHEQAKAIGGSRESKQQTIREHEARIIAGREDHYNQNRGDAKWRDDEE